jgi:FAD:protein FMN transferase
MSELDVTFPAMGSDIRLLLGAPLEPGLPDPAEAAARARAFAEDFDTRLSRFRPDSELCALNRDERGAVPASRLMCSVVAAGLWAADRSGGLVDPTLLGQIEAAGYRRSRRGVAPASLSDALYAAPPRRAACPSPAGLYRGIAVDQSAGIVRRPRGVRIDTGGAGKGLCADAIAHMLRGYSRFVIDCGGDMRVGGPEARTAPYRIELEHPLTRDHTDALSLGSGAIATSGINSRVWRSDDGGYAHHLLDPATGEPAWTGLISVTALARSALEAETLAKTAFLLGPRGARRVLRARGGAIVHDDGRVERLGSCWHEPLLHLRVAPLAKAAA